MDIAQILLVASCFFLISNSVSGEEDSPMTYRVSADRHQDTSNSLEGGGYESLKKYMLPSDVTCNDGSPAGFYLRQSNYSKMWIVFLEEGWCCYDKISCDMRWSRASNLMSSKKWTDTKTVGGILSNNPNENPFWWQANHVFVPYCTSDIWSGRRSEPHHGSKFSFMGSLVIKQVIRELLPMGLAHAHTLILSGSSAGGVGVMLNLDPIQKMLRQYTSLTVHGISDSGWFMDKPSFHFKGKKMGQKKIKPIEAVKLGIPYWHSQIPSRCRSLYTDEPFECFIGYRIYPTVTVPIFVFTWLFDEFQLENEIDAPIDKQQWDFVHKMGERQRKSLRNVTAVFAPSCVSHKVLTKKDWKDIKIDSVSLPAALHCWHIETRYAKLNSNKLGSGRGNSSYNHKHHHDDDGHKSAEGALTKVHGHTTENALNVEKPKTSRPGDGVQTPRPRVIEVSSRSVHKKRKRHHKNHGSCRHRYIQSCSWPQCNNSCPKLQNPHTGEEIDFIELLKSFGVNISNLSIELGIDIDSLMHMDQGELLNLLTQQSN